MEIKLHLSSTFSRTIRNICWFHGSGKGAWQAIVYDGFFKPVVANDNILNVITFPLTPYLSSCLGISSCSVVKSSFVCEEKPGVCAAQVFYSSGLSCWSSAWSWAHSAHSLGWENASFPRLPLLFQPLTAVEGHQQSVPTAPGFKGTGGARSR